LVSAFQQVGLEQEKPGGESGDAAAKEMRAAIHRSRKRRWNTRPRKELAPHCILAALLCITAEVTRIKPRQTTKRKIRIIVYDSDTENFVNYSPPADRGILFAARSTRDNRQPTPEQLTPD